MQDEVKPDLMKFPDKIKFWTYINTLTDGLDFRNTIKLPNFWFYHEGTKYVTRSFKETLDELNKICLTKFDTKNSIAVGSRVTLFINPRFEVVEDVVEETPEELSFEEPTLEYSVSEEPLLDLELDLQEDQESPDWDHVDSLYDDSDKRASKDRLEDYARKWDVELAKNKSFENMVKEFKEAL